LTNGLCAFNSHSIIREVECGERLQLIGNMADENKEIKYLSNLIYL